MGIGTILTKYNGVVQVETNGNPPPATQHRSAVAAKFNATPPTEGDIEGILTEWNSAAGPKAFEITQAGKSLRDYKGAWFSTWDTQSAAFPPI